MGGRPPPGADLESLGGPCRPLPPKDPGSGPRDSDGSCVGCASGTKFPYLPEAEDGAQPGSPSDPDQFPLPKGGLSLRPAAQDAPQSPAPCPGVSGKAGTGQRAAEQVVVGAGGEDGPAASHNQEELEVKAWPVSMGRPGQGLPAPTDTPVGSPESAASKARSGPFMGQRRPKCAKLGRGPVPPAEDRGTDSRSDNFSHDPDPPAASRPGGFPKPVS